MVKPKVCHRRTRPTRGSGLQSGGGTRTRHTTIRPRPGEEVRQRALPESDVAPPSAEEAELCAQDSRDAFPEARSGARGRGAGRSGSRSPEAPTWPQELREEFSKISHLTYKRVCVTVTCLRGI